MFIFHMVALITNLILSKKSSLLFIMLSGQLAFYFLALLKLIFGINAKVGVLLSLLLLYDLGSTIDGHL